MKRSINKYTLAAGIVAVAVMLIIATSLLAARSGDSLNSTTWQLTLLNGHAPHSTAEPISLTFENRQQASGSSGCNTYGGIYTVSGSTLRISEVVSTLRACTEPELNTQESEYYQALGLVATYEQTDNQLTLKDANDIPVLVFAKS